MSSNAPPELKWNRVKPVPISPLTDEYIEYIVPGAGTNGFNNSSNRKAVLRLESQNHMIDFNTSYWTADVLATLDSGGTTTFKLECGFHSFIKRYRLYFASNSGQPIDDIDNYNVVYKFLETVQVSPDYQDTLHRLLEDGQGTSTYSADARINQFTGNIIVGAALDAAGSYSCEILQKPTATENAIKLNTKQCFDHRAGRLYSSGTTYNMRFSPLGSNKDIEQFFPLFKFYGQTALTFEFEFESDLYKPFIVAKDSLNSDISASTSITSYGILNLTLHAKSLQMPPEVDDAILRSFNGGITMEYSTWMSTLVPSTAITSGYASKKNVQFDFRTPSLRSLYVYPINADARYQDSKIGSTCFPFTDVYFQFGSKRYPQDPIKFEFNRVSDMAYHALRALSRVNDITTGALMDPDYWRGVSMAGTAITDLTYVGQESSSTSAVDQVISKAMFGWDFETYTSSLSAGKLFQGISTIGVGEQNFWYTGNEPAAARTLDIYFIGLVNRVITITDQGGLNIDVV